MLENKGQLIAFLVKIGSVLVIFYVIFLLGKSIWTNYDLRQSIQKLNSQIATLEIQKKQLADLNLYYASDPYKELEARKKLGLKKPDEKVVIIAAAETKNFQDQLTQDQLNLSNEEDTQSSPNWILWLDFFTK